MDSLSDKIKDVNESVSSTKDSLFKKMEYDFFTQWKPISINSSKILNDDSKNLAKIIKIQRKLAKLLSVKKSKTLNWSKHKPNKTSAIIPKRPTLVTDQTPKANGSMMSALGLLLGALEGLVGLFDTFKSFLGFKRKTPQVTKPAHKQKISKFSTKPPQGHVEKNKLSPKLEVLTKDESVKKDIVNKTELTKSVQQAKPAVTNAPTNVSTNVVKNNVTDNIPTSKDNVAPSIPTSKDNVAPGVNKNKSVLSTLSSKMPQTKLGKAGLIAGGIAGIAGLGYGISKLFSDDVLTDENNELLYKIDKHILNIMNYFIKRKKEVLRKKQDVFNKDKSSGGSGNITFSKKTLGDSGDTETNESNGFFGSIGSGLSSMGNSISSAFSSGVDAVSSATSFVSNGVSETMSSAADVVKNSTAIAKNFAVSGADVQTAIKNASKKSGVNLDILVAMAKIESGFNPSARAKTSTAGGLYQFLDNTWRTVMQSHAREYGLTGNESKFDPQASAYMGAAYIKDNIKDLKSVKSDINSTDVYMAHFLGSGGAKKFLRALLSNPMQAAAPLMPDAAMANKPIFFTKGNQQQTLRAIYFNFAVKMGDSKALQGATSEYSIVNDKKFSDAPKVNPQPSVMDSTKKPPVKKQPAVINKTTEDSQPQKPKTKQPNKSNNTTQIALLM